MRAAADTDGDDVTAVRVHTLLVAASARLTAGYPADEYLQLAHLGCALPVDHPDAPVAASVRELLARHAAYTATNPRRQGPRVPGIHLIFVAAAVARSPALQRPARDPAAPKTGEGVDPRG